MTYGFVFSHGKRAVAEGQLTTVCCRLDAKSPPRSIPIPDWIVAKLAGPARAQAPRLNSYAPARLIFIRRVRPLDRTPHARFDRTKPGACVSDPW